MRAQGVQLSIIIPAYNEATRLENSLLHVADYLEAKPYDAEIVVVDDGSKDDTLGVVKQVSERSSVPVLVLHYPNNRGKGFALKVGFAHASGRFLLFTDADLSTPIEEADRILEHLEDGIDVVIGSRNMQGARIIVHQPRLRESMGRVFTWMVRRLFVDVSDITCGFKGFRSSVGKELFALQRVSDWSFDAELLFLAEKLGYGIREIPVEWSNFADSKVNIVRASIDSLWGLIRIRWYAASGRYRTHLEIAEEIRDWRSSSYVGPDLEAEA